LSDFGEISQEKSTRAPTMRKMNTRIIPLTLSALLLVIFGAHATPAQPSDSPLPHDFQLDGDVAGTHDPSIIKDGDTWYLFATATGKNQQGELPIRCSKDLHHWKECGTVFPALPEWITKELPGTKDLWAPDISYFNGKFHLYYAFSLFGKNTSGIALLTNKTLNPDRRDFHWVDEGLVLRSHTEDDFNAIDPNLVLDANGHAWLSFGSFWTGIKMRRIDPKTGKLDAKDVKVYSLARRLPPENPPPNPQGLPGNWQAIEAPFVIHHDGYYYLFVSFDLCCRGTKSNYKTMVGRSRNVTGPYTDGDEKSMMEGGGTPLLVGNETWIGPGGESILHQKDGDIIVFHAYDGKTGRPSLQISSLLWSGGWPHAALEDVPKSQDK
jgi:arabinan endo-1,5-alpha-L-arabinosidase